MSPVFWISHSSSRLGVTYFADALRAQRVVQVVQSLEHPRLAAAIVHVGERREPALALGGVGGERRHHEREAGLAIGVLDPLLLRREDVAPAFDLAHRQFQRQRRVVGFGERQPVNRHAASPRRVRSHAQCGRGQRDVAERAEPRRFLTRRLRRGQSRLQQRSRVRARAPGARAGARKRHHAPAQ